MYYPGSTVAFKEKEGVVRRASNSFVYLQTLGIYHAHNIPSGHFPICVSWLCFLASIRTPTTFKACQALFHCPKQSSSSIAPVRLWSPKMLSVLTDCFHVWFGNCKSWLSWKVWLFYFALPNLLFYVIKMQPSATYHAPGGEQQHPGAGHGTQDAAPHQAQRS